MIEIEIVSYNGQAPAQPVHREFGPMGGTIGRAEGNTLVLLDPDRCVSRTHAMIAFRGGIYVLRDLGSTSPVHVNGQPVGNGREVRLAVDDEIQIGGYTLRVRAASTKVTPPPTAARPAAPPLAPKDDPLAMFGQPNSDPFADLLPLATTPPSTADPAGAYGGRNDPRHSPETVPPGFDPFADLLAPPAPVHPMDDPVKPGRAPDDFNLGLEPAASQNIDLLFGLKEGGGTDPLAGGDPLGDLGGGTGRASSLDPLVAMGVAPAPQLAPGTERNDGMEIRAAFSPPSVWFNAVDPNPPPVQIPPVQPQAPPVLSDQNSMLFSWDAPNQATPGSEIKTVVVSSPRQAASVAPPPQEASPAAVIHNEHGARAAPAPSLQNAPARHDAAALDDLLRAFLTGAGVPDLDFQGALTPQAMHMVGQLLRESTQGMLDLLLARALIKREIRAELTMIMPRENNPLKFSPNVEVALSHLLAPRGQGFMSPVAAMHDAADDLRAHQFGFMAGMRAALDGVLQRFDPEQLEQRLTDKSILDSMLPMNRKAKLWTLFAELYGDITKEAQDDFHTLFGKEFLRAYESQLDKLKETGHDAPHSDRH